MQSDTISLIIAGAAGLLLGSWITATVLGCFVSKVRRDAEKQTWAAANRYYSRKGAES